MGQWPVVSRHTMTPKKRTKRFKHWRPHSLATYLVDLLHGWGPKSQVFAQEPSHNPSPSGRSPWIHLVFGVSVVSTSQGRQGESAEEPQASECLATHGTRHGPSNTVFRQSVATRQMLWHMHRGTSWVLENLGFRESSRTMVHLKMNAMGRCSM